MLGWLFGKKNANDEDEGIELANTSDGVFQSQQALLDALREEAIDFCEEQGEESAVLVVVWTAAMLDTVAALFADRDPLRASGPVDAPALRARLARTGTISIALADALVPEARPGADARIEVMVVHRNAQRAADDAIVAFAQLEGPQTHVGFFLSLDDPLLSRFGANLTPLIRKIGLQPHEVISHPLVSRAIRDAQR